LHIRPEAQDLRDRLFNGGFRGARRAWIERRDLPRHAGVEEKREADRNCEPVPRLVAEEPVGQPDDIARNTAVRRFRSSVKQTRAGGAGPPQAALPRMDQMFVPFRQRRRAKLATLPRAGPAQQPPQLRESAAHFTIPASSSSGTKPSEGSRRPSMTTASISGAALDRYCPPVPRPPAAERAELPGERRWTTLSARPTRETAAPREPGRIWSFSSAPATRVSMLSGCRPWSSSRAEQRSSLA